MDNTISIDFAPSMWEDWQGRLTTWKFIPLLDANCALEISKEAGGIYALRLKFDLVHKSIYCSRLGLQIEAQAENGWALFSYGQP
jgi:hypothetical protein